jgi:hypothetical protein
MTELKQMAAEAYDPATSQFRLCSDVALWLAHEGTQRKQITHQVSNFGTSI